MPFADDTPGEPSGDTAPPRAGPPQGQAGSGDIRGQLQLLNVRQKAFEKYLAAQLGTDAIGLDTMYHLISAQRSTPTDLARAVGISTAAMTLVLGRLEEAGHVQRAPHPSDRRKVVITPAAPSDELAAQLVAPMIEGLDRLIHALGERDRAVVLDFLVQVTGLYRAITPDP